MKAWLHTDLPHQISCRQVIADAVLADPFEWNEAVLGKVSASLVWLLTQRFSS